MASAEGLAIDGAPKRGALGERGQAARSHLCGPEASTNRPHPHDHLFMNNRDFRNIPSRLTCSNVLLKDLVVHGLRELFNRRKRTNDTRRIRHHCSAGKLRVHQISSDCCRGVDRRYRCWSHVFGHWSQGRPQHSPRRTSSMSGAE